MSQVSMCIELRPRAMDKVVGNFLHVGHLLILTYKLGGDEKKQHYIVHVVIHHSTASSSFFAFHMFTAGLVSVRETLMGHEILLRLTAMERQFVLQAMPVD